MVSRLSARTDAGVFPLDSSRACAWRPGERGSAMKQVIQVSEKALNVNTSMT